MFLATACSPLWLTLTRPCRTSVALACSRLAEDTGYLSQVSLQCRTWVYVCGCISGLIYKLPSDERSDLLLPCPGPASMLRALGADLPYYELQPAECPSGLAETQANAACGLSQVTVACSCMDLLKECKAFSFTPESALRILEGFFSSAMVIRGSVSDIHQASHTAGNFCTSRTRAQGLARPSANSC